MLADLEKVNRGKVIGRIEKVEIQHEKENKRINKSIAIGDFKKF